MRAPPSKSYTHRAFLLAALSGGQCRIEDPLLSEDTEATLAALEALGARTNRSPGVVRITCPERHVPVKEIDARNSGTTLRLLSGVVAVLDGTSVLTGDASLRQRPMGPLVAALNELGARVRAFGLDGRPPIEVTGPLRGGSVTVPGSVSSQFLSSLLIACPLAPRPTELRVTPPVLSEPYVEITQFMLRRFGVDVEGHGTRFRIPGGQRYEPTDFAVPGDFSSAAFPLVAAGLSSGGVTVEGLDPSMPQGDRRLVDILAGFGVEVTSAADTVSARGGTLHAQTVDLGATPDLFPVLAVLATQAEGESRFVNGAHLRLKESDRIESTVAFLKTMGADVRATQDGCVVRGPAPLHGAKVDARGDHRILMAAAVAGLTATEDTDVTDPWSFRVSYPTFLDDFRALGADLEVVP
jgi:3-phosphoshikimate 1-carboxyvinyltransferase